MRRASVEIRNIAGFAVILGATTTIALLVGGTVWPVVGMAAESVTGLSGMGVQFMPAYVADKEKLFEKEGVNVAMKYSTTGKVAVDGMVAGAGVMAISGIFPAVSAAATGTVYVIAPLAIEDGDTKLIVRSGINGASDLKGKRVGYQLGSDGHMFMISYLRKSGLAPTDITSENVPAEALVAAFSRGDLDAIAVWEPIAGKALSAVAGAKVLADKGVVPIYDPLTMRKDFVESQPETAGKLLRAIVAANNFIKANPDRAAQDCADVMQLPVAEVKQLMSTYVFDQTLDKGFYDGMDAVANFLYVTQATKQKADPHQFVYDRLMREVAPNLVQ